MKRKILGFLIVLVLAFGLMGCNPFGKKAEENPIKGTGTIVVTFTKGGGTSATRGLTSTGTEGWSDYNTATRSLTAPAWKRSSAQVAPLVKTYRLKIVDGAGQVSWKDLTFADGQNTVTGSLTFREGAYRIDVLAIGPGIKFFGKDYVNALGFGRASNIQVVADQTTQAKITLKPIQYAYEDVAAKYSPGTLMKFKFLVRFPYFEEYIQNPTVEDANWTWKAGPMAFDCDADSATNLGSRTVISADSIWFYAFSVAPDVPGTLYHQAILPLSDMTYNGSVPAILSGSIALGDVPDTLNVGEASTTGNIGIELGWE